VLLPHPRKPAVFCVGGRTQSAGLVAAKAATFTSRPGPAPSPQKKRLDSVSWGVGVCSFVPVASLGLFLSGALLCAPPCLPASGCLVLSCRRGVCRPCGVGFGGSCALWALSLWLVFLFRFCFGFVWFSRLFFVSLCWGLGVFSGRFPSPFCCALPFCLWFFLLLLRCLLALVLCLLVLCLLLGWLVFVLLLVFGGVLVPVRWCCLCCSVAVFLRCWLFRLLGCLLVCRVCLWFGAVVVLLLLWWLLLGCPSSVVVAFLVLSLLVRVRVVGSFLLLLPSVLRSWVRSVFRCLVGRSLCCAPSFFLPVLGPVFSRFSAFGFSGSRSVVPASFFLAAAAVPPAASVFVGCAAGVDGSSRSLFSSASVFRAASFSAPSWGARLALRSSACVRAVAAASGLWVSFPGRSCPSGLVPCASPFGGSGSGSWASLALAVFLRVPSVLFLPAGVPFPPSWRSRCVCSLLGFAPCGGAFFLLSPLPAALSLFPAS